jgi:hypothetical protein
METLPGVIAAALVCLFGLLLWRAQTRNAQSKKNRVAGRDPAETAQAWADYSREFGIGEELVSEVIPVVASATDIEPSELRPTDRFERELAEERGWQFDSGLNEIRWYLEKTAQRNLSDAELAELCTVGDVIRFAARFRGGMTPAT